MKLVLIAIFPLILAIANLSHSAPAESRLARTKIPVYPFTVTHVYPHAPQNFTEGLLLDKGFLYESAGLYQQSKLQKIDLYTGKVLKQYELPAQYFAEGIAVIGDDLYQLTYQEHIGFVYDKNSFKLKNKFNIPAEGWGLTSDGQQLIMSDGTATLAFINPINFAITRKLIVTNGQQQIASLNSLEYIDGKIYANIFPTDRIAIISPVTGRVEAWIDIHSLNTRSNCAADACVANGIAYDTKNAELLVTGKNWLHIYGIRLRD